MPSKALIDRHKQVDHLICLTQTHAESVSEILTDDACRMGFPGQAPGFSNLQRVHARWLEVVYEKLDRAEAAYLHKKDHAGWLRKRRDELSKTLYDQVVMLRGFLDRVYGKPAALQMTGLKGKTPRDPFELAQAGLALVKRLRKHGTDLPDVELAGLSFRPEETAEALEPLVRELDETWHALQDWNREVEGLLLDRNAARDRLDNLLTGMHQLLEGLYTAAGLKHLVPGIRNPGASVRRAMRTASETLRTRPRHSQSGPESLKTASHPVRTGVWVGETAERPPSAASKLPNSASHAVRRRLETDETGSRLSILRFEHPDATSHAVRSQHRGETGGGEPVEAEDRATAGG